MHIGCGAVTVCQRMAGIAGMAGINNGGHIQLYSPTSDAQNLFRVVYHSVGKLPNGKSHYCMARGISWSNFLMCARVCTRVCCQRSGSIRFYILKKFYMAQPVYI